MALTVVACCTSSFPFGLKSVQYIINYLILSPNFKPFLPYLHPHQHINQPFPTQNLPQNPKHPPKSSKVQTAFGGRPGSGPRRGLRVGLGPPAGRMEFGPSDAGAHPPGECPAESGGIGWELWDLWKGGYKGPNKKKKQIKSDQHRWWMAIPHVWTNPNILSRYIPSLYELPSGYD